MERESYGLPPLEQIQSRRKFIRKTGRIAAGIAMLGVTGLIMEDNTSDEVLFDSLSPEQQYEIQEIESFRNRIGLSSLPKELNQAIRSQKDEWQHEQVPFQNNLPQVLTSYGMTTEYVLNKTFGENATRLVRQVEVDKSMDKSIGFYGNDRRIVLSRNIDIKDIETEFPDYVLHEAIGHGSDPYHRPTLYPLDTLIKVEHGKWRMLSQAYLVEGQYFNHPEDKMYPAMKKQIGEKIARSLIDNTTSSLFQSDTYLEPLQNTLTELSEMQNISPTSLAYNKFACEKIGETIFENMYEESITFNSELEEDYESITDKSLKEIYAEMMKMAILHPENANSEIIAGCEEILSAISPSHKSIDTLRADIQNIPTSILGQRFLEQQTKMVIKLDGNIPHRASSIHLKQAQKEEHEYEKRQEQFEMISKYGVFPLETEIEEELKQNLNTFAHAYHTITTTYPSLRNTWAQNVDFQFDPYLHIWNIRKIENAVDTRFVNTLIKQINSEGAYDRKILTEKNNILKNFLDSPAFGTNTNWVL